MGLAAAAVLFLVLFAFVFWPERNPFTQRLAGRLDFLQERREMVMNNLRDLNFEYRSGKYPEQDYAMQRDLLENEASTILAEIDLLERNESTSKRA